MTAAPERCPTCDRADCPRVAHERAGMPAKVRAAFARMLADANANPPRRLRDDDRAVADERAKVSNAAAADCHAHTVVWRDRCLATESTLSTARAEADRLRAGVESAERKLSHYECEHEKYSLAARQMIEVACDLRAALAGTETAP